MVADNKAYKELEVYTADNQKVGKIEELYDKDFLVAGQRIPFSMIARTEQDRVYLTTSSTQYSTAKPEKNTPEVSYTKESNIPDYERKPKTGYNSPDMNHIGADDNDY